MNFPDRSILSRLSGVVAVLVIVVTGSVAISQRKYYELRKIGPADWGAAFTANANTDAWLRAGLRELDWKVTIPYPHTSLILRESLDPLPTDKGILVITNKVDPNFTNVFSVIEYFSLPRRLYYLDCDTPNAPKPLNAPVGAVIYYNVSIATMLPQARMILPHLTLVPVNQPAEWKSYCLP